MELGGRTRAEQAQKTLGNPAQLLSAEIEYEDLYADEYGRNWEDLGVISTAMITGVSNLGSGIAVLVDDANHVFRSTDDGATWTDLGIITTAGITDVSNLGNGIAIIGDEAFHVWRSTDYGETWVDIGAIATAKINGIVNIGNGVSILCCQDTHIHRSVDYGVNWADLGVITAGGVIDGDYLGNGVVVVAELGGHIWRSINNGLNWVDWGDAGISIWGIKYLGGGIAVLGSDNGHIWRSTDRGLTWVDLGVVATIPGGFYEAPAYLGNGIVIIGDDQNCLYRSADNGVTWVKLAATASGAISAMESLGNGIAIIGDAAFHVWRSAPSSAVSIYPLSKQIRQSICHTTDPTGSIGKQLTDDLSGKMQTAIKTLDLNTAVVGLNDLFTGTAQTVIIEKLIIKMPDVVGAAPMTGITIQTDHTTPQQFITAAQGAVANMTAQNQFFSTDPISLEAGKKAQLTLAGGNHAAAYLCTIEALYRAVTSGGSLA